MGNTHKQQTFYTELDKLFNESNLIKILEFYYVINISARCKNELLTIDLVNKIYKIEKCNLINSTRDKQSDNEQDDEPNTYKNMCLYTKDVEGFDVEYFCENHKMTQLQDFIESFGWKHHYRSARITKNGLLICESTYSFIIINLDNMKILSNEFNSDEFISRTNYIRINANYPKKFHIIYLINDPAIKIVKFGSYHHENPINIVSKENYIIMQYTDKLIVQNYITNNEYSININNVGRFKF